MVVFSKTIVALASLASVVSAVPTGQTRKGFTVNQIPKPATKAKNYAASYAQALAKYGAAVPTQIQAAAVSGSAVTTPDNTDLEYLTPVNVGGTTLNLDFDTGSADL